MDATKNARGQFAPSRPLEAHDAQLVQIAIKFFNDLLRVGNEVALCFIHHGDQFSSDSRPATKVFARRGVWRKSILSVIAIHCCFEAGLAITNGSTSISRR